MSNPRLLPPAKSPSQKGDELKKETLRGRFRSPPQAPGKLKSPRLGQEAETSKILPSPKTVAKTLATSLPGTKADTSNEELLQGLLTRAKEEAVPKVTRVDVEDDTSIDEGDPLVKSF